MVSPTDDGKLRSWRVIAAVLSQETNPHKILALATELNAALSGQDPNIDVEDVHVKDVPTRQSDGS